MTAEIVNFEPLPVKKERLHKELEQAFYEALANTVIIDDGGFDNAYHGLIKNKKVKQAIENYNQFLEKYYPKSERTTIEIFV